MSLPIDKVDPGSSMAVDPSDRKLYLQSPDPEAIRRFDATYKAQPRTPTRSVPENPRQADGPSAISPRAPEKAYTMSMIEPFQISGNDILETTEEWLGEQAGDAFWKIIGVAEGAAEAAPGVIVNSFSDDERGLTQQEIDALKPIFDESIDYTKVRLNESSALVAANGALPSNSRPRPFVVGNTINAAGPLTMDDLVHEMAHIWQFQTRGPSYALALFDPDYKYEMIDLQAHASDPLGSRLDNFKTEVQGEIIKDYYLLRDQLSDPMLTPQAEQRIRAELDTYRPYIEELKDAQPLNGVAGEANEAVDETVREWIEAGGEIIQSGGSPAETLEGSFEIGREILEGSAETGRAWVEDKVGALEDEFSRRWPGAVTTSWR